MIHGHLKMKLIDLTVRYGLLERVQMSDQDAAHAWLNVRTDVRGASPRTSRAREIRLHFSKRDELGPLEDGDHRVVEKCGLDCRSLGTESVALGYQSLSSPNTGHPWSTQLRSKWVLVGHGLNRSPR